MEKTDYLLNEKFSSFFKLSRALYCVSGNVVIKFRINFSKKKRCKVWKWVFNAIKVMLWKYVEYRKHHSHPFIRFCILFTCTYHKVTEMLKINLNCKRDYKNIFYDVPHCFFILILIISKNLSMYVTETDFTSSFIVIVANITFANQLLRT